MDNEFKVGAIVYHKIFHKFGKVTFLADRGFIHVKVTDALGSNTKLWLEKNIVAVSNDSPQTKLMMDIKYGQ
jgi:hypothetical protein